MSVTVSVKGLIKPIVSLERKSVVREGAETMLRRNVGSLVVSDAGNYVGIVTERDILRKITALGKDPAKVTLDEIMSSPLITIDARQGLGEATSLMLKQNIRRLAVVEDGKVVGIFTQRDLQQKVMEVFRSIAEAEGVV